MTIDRRQYLKSIAAVTAGSAVASSIGAWPASAQSRSETLRHVTGGVVTSLDPTLPGSTRESLQLSVNIYDRLASFGRKKVPGGYVFDLDNIRGELAERIDRSDDGLSYTFHIRQGATWHDGSPVEVADIKWSLDRAVSASASSKTQMALGSMTSPEQFKVVGDRQIEAKIARPDRLTLATFCVPFEPMYNSKLAKKHATSDDPWAANWLKENTAAGGAYIVESNRPGQQVVLQRNENWKNGEGGKLPSFKRIILQTIPDVSSRASLLERGDADLVLDAAASDIPGLEQRGKVTVITLPQSNAFQCISFNTRAAPFDNPKLRSAIAAGLPYDAMFKAAIFERGKKLYGAQWKEPPTPSILQAMPNNYDPDRAKALLAESGHASGLKISFSFPASAAPTAEPMAALIKESLSKLGVDVTVQKLPDSQMVTMIAERKLHIFFDYYTSWLPTADYLTRNFFSADNRWNSSGWADPEIIKLGEEMRYEQDQAKYDRMANRVISRIQDQMPVSMLWHPNHDAVIAKDITGYTYWYHRGADYRDLKRA